MAVVETLEDVIHQRNVLMEEIANTAIDIGLIRPDAYLTGPHLLMLLGDFAEIIKSHEERLKHYEDIVAIHDKVQAA